jgi:hypothetical protein
MSQISECNLLHTSNNSLSQIVQKLNPAGGLPDYETKQPWVRNR